MYFQSAKLRDYRNFKTLRAHFSPRLNILIGDNGQGKTNLLESLYLSAQGRSFRYGGSETLIRNGQDLALIETQILRKDLDHRVILQIQKSRKSASVNQKKISSIDLRKMFPTVLFSPESLASIKEGSDRRRELVDDFLITHRPQNADLIADYRMTLKARNRILKHLGDDDPNPAKNSALEVLESLQPRFLRLGSALTEARLQALREIEPDLRNALQYISGNSAVDISVEMLVSGEKTNDWNREQINNALQQRLIDLRDAEIASGTSLVGPHKHEILFLYQQKDSRFFCSQGQQRAIILAFKMAQIVYHRKAHGFYPVLMLDDVLSELDTAKRKALIAFLHEINTQVFLTTADAALPGLFQLTDSAVLHVASGEIHSSN